MQTCRFKIRDRNSGLKFCHCFHVRTCTIFFGVWHMLLHFLALTMVFVMLRYPDLIANYDVGIQVRSDADGPMTPTTPLTELDVKRDGAEIQLTLGQIPEKPITIQNHMPSHQDINSCAIFTFCTFMITLMMVYGAVKGRPIYILPFFCLQIFDFCLTSLTAIGFLLYMPDVHGLIANCRSIPFQNELMQLNEQCLSLLVLLTFIMALIVKGYFIRVVWCCYKYIMLRRLPSQRTIHYIDTESLLPTYEAAVKKFPAPPPSYATATRNHPSPQPFPGQEPLSVPTVAQAQAPPQATTPTPM